MNVIIVQDDTLNKFSIRFNAKAYPRVDNKFGDYSATVIPDDSVFWHYYPLESIFYKQQRSYMHIFSYTLSTHWWYKIQYLLKKNR